MNILDQNSNNSKNSTWKKIVLSKKKNNFKIFINENVENTFP